MNRDITSIELFELFLLDQMHDSENVRSALKQLGVSPSRMSEAADHVGNKLGINHAGHSISIYLELLGKPIEEVDETDVEPASDYHGSRRFRFHLPLWALFDFVVRAHPDGWAWGLEFVRSRAAPPADPAKRPSQLRPWTVLESEVRERFGAPTEEYPFGHTNQAFYEENGAAGSLTVELGYVMGLLQTVDG